jgi:hypothetical protein
VGRPHLRGRRQWCALSAVFTEPAILTAGTTYAFTIHSVTARATGTYGASFSTTTAAYPKGTRVGWLRGVTVKGDIDLEWDVLAAERDWRQVLQLARELGDKGWENRANGELGIVAFLKGDTGEATTLVHQAFQAAEKSGDVGGQLRYMGTRR